MANNIEKRKNPRKSNERQGKDRREFDRGTGDRRKINNRIANRREEDREKEDIYSDQIEGRNAVIELLESGKDINKLYITKGDRTGSINKIIAIAKEKKAK